MNKPPASDFRWREEGGGEAAGARCFAFLDTIGIGYEHIGKREAQLLEGLAILEGKILLDPGAAIWPGDVLHEAGHIAVTPADRRPTLGPIEPDRIEEVAAIAWSYAAARECGLALREIFHADGYHSKGENWIKAYSAGQFIGWELLQMRGMATDMRSALAQGVPSYPGMIRWLN